MTSKHIALVSGVWLCSVVTDVGNRVLIEIHYPQVGQCARPNPRKTAALASDLLTLIISFDGAQRWRRVL